MRFHASWSKEAKRYFTSVIQAHGGWDAWERVDSLSFRLKEFRGALVFAKGLHRTFHPPKELKIFPKKRRVEFSYDGHGDLFDDGRITFSPARTVVVNGRSLFKGSTFEQWRPEHAAYFFGYAWSNYLSYPFILPEFELLRFRIGDDVSYFEIKFPENFHNHCRVQNFIFGPDHLLLRHDYHAELAGPLVYGAHVTEDYVSHQGLQLGIIRKVHPRIGRFALPIYGIYGEIEPF